MPFPAVTDGLQMQPTFQGVAQGARTIKNVSVDTTLTQAESGSIILVVGSTGAVNITLPAITKGKPFEFEIINCSDQNLTVTAETADTINTYNDLAADSVAFSTASEKIGGAFRVVCDGVTLCVLARPATIYQTVTIAT